MSGLPEPDRWARPELAAVCVHCRQTVEVLVGVPGSVGGSVGGDRSPLCPRGVRRPVRRHHLPDREPAWQRERGVHVRTGKHRERGGPDLGPDVGDGCDALDLCGCDCALLLAPGLAVPLALGLLAPTRALGLHGEQPASSDVTGRLLAAVRLYQLRVSAHRGPRCRYRPTCSAYATGALRRHGAARGTRLALSRLARCRPGGPGGADPVPGA